MAKEKPRKAVYSADSDEDLVSPFEVLKGFQAQRADPVSDGSRPAPRNVQNAAAANPDVQRGHPVRVSRERKGRGGKTVSIISGIQGSTTRKQALLKLLKQRLGTGGALKADTIEIQGDQRERIVEILMDLGYPAKVAGG